MNSIDVKEGLTGIDFLDRAILEEETSVGVHAILGATGTGITTLASMVAAEGARRALKNVSVDDQVRWAFFTTQASVQESKCRLASYLGKLDFGAATEGELRCIGQHDNPDDQWAYASSIVEKAMIVFDTNKFPRDTWGTQAFQADQLLRAEAGATRLAGITFDDVPSMLRARLYESGASDAGFTRLMANFLHECRELSERFSCPVWIGHQLRGAVAIRGPRAITTHNDAMYFKRLGEHVKTSFVIGNHDGAGAFQIRCTKPYLHDQDLLPVVRITGGGATIEEVSPPVRNEFLTDSWNEPSFKCRPEVLEALLERRAELQNSSRKEDLAARMVRAAGIDDANAT